MEEKLSAEEEAKFWREAYTKIYNELDLSDALRVRKDMRISELICCLAEIIRLTKAEGDAEDIFKIIREKIQKTIDRGH